MPIITPFPDPIRAYVRVEVNWADTPAVEFARVLRVDSVTGVCTPLRPYICFDGDYLKLSCGHGIFWDTEVPLDRQVYYLTEGLDAPCIPDGPTVLDTFTRVVVDGWGSADTGQAYSLTGGVAANFDVNGTQGTVNPTAVDSDRLATVNVSTPDQDAQITVVTPPTPTGGSYESGIAARFTDASNYYSGVILVSTAGVVSAQINKRVAGARSMVATIATTLLTGTTGINVRFQVIGSLLRLRLWDVASAEPTSWNLSVTDTSLTTGNRVGSFTRRNTGNTTPTVYTYDNFTVLDLCEDCTPVTTQTDPLTIGSDGMFRLKDPVRPCRDLAVPLCFDQVPSPECLPGSGVFFASMGEESYASNSLSVNPTNARRPISVHRTRRDVASVLTLVTRTFADRDALNLITEPGSPLLFQGPPQYGIPDRYMDVGDVNEERGLSDHRYPVRVATLPHVAVDRPAGPSQGVCGSQVADLCDTYTTWAELEAAGLTWDDLIRGRAGQPDPTTAYRTWDDVEAEFADWDDVDNGTRTWTDLEVGN